MIDENKTWHHPMKSLTIGLSHAGGSILLGCVQHDYRNQRLENLNDGSEAFALG